MQQMKNRSNWNEEIAMKMRGKASYVASCRMAVWMGHLGAQPCENPDLGAYRQGVVRAPYNSLVIRINERVTLRDDDPCSNAP